MKRLHILVLVAAIAALVLAFPSAAFAESFAGKSGWEVTYTANGKMKDNFSQKQYADQISKLEPGDDVTFTVKLHHKNADDADWYMSNEIIDAFETATAKDSLYEYELTYTSPTGKNSRTLFSSKLVGGEGSDGLKELNDVGLKDFFYLDNLSNGQTATVTLKVKMDGETEDNGYFNTDAVLKMRFAVQPVGSDGKKGAVKTGDDTDLFPFYLIMIVSGALLLVLAIVSLRRRKLDRQVGNHAR